jgi:hypothetical protein
MRRNFMVLPEKERDPLDRFMQSLFPRAIVNPSYDHVKPDKYFIYFVTAGMWDINIMYLEFRDMTSLIFDDKYRLTFTKDADHESPRLKLTVEHIPRVHKEVIDLDN